MKEILAAIDWKASTDSLDIKGFAHLPSVLPDQICERFAAEYDRPELYRKTVVMERHRFGVGEYKYFDHPLPKIIQDLRESIYPILAPIANSWVEKLRMDVRFPLTFAALQDRCRANGQTKPTPLILKYGQGGFNTLHQDLYGEVFFPIQLAIFLNEPDADYTGGEFVLNEQIPRSQSKAIVLRPRKGDMILFPTNFRPARGVNGHYRVNLKHGVSEVLSGNRHTLGVIFHDALS